jgi:hypothetical protein
MHRNRVNQYQPDDEIPSLRQFREETTGLTHFLPLSLVSRTTRFFDSQNGKICEEDLRNLGFSNIIQ